MGGMPARKPYQTAKRAALPADLPRPSRRGNPDMAAIEGRVLDRLLLR